MGWLGYQIRKPLTGVVIGVYAVLSAVLPRIAKVVTSEIGLSILRGALGETGVGFVIQFDAWEERVKV